MIIVLIMAAIPTVISASPSENKVLNDNYNGETIYIKKGDSFNLQLKENVMTGYLWKIRLSNGLILINTKIYQTGFSHIFGGYQIQEWAIKAVAGRNQQVIGIYRRPWMKETSVGKIFTLNVNVI
jgi:inhibitor of cysteine peptidase